MSKSDILAELPKLTREERHEVRAKLAELDGDVWLDGAGALDDSDQATLESRLAAYEEDKNAGDSWKEVEARLHARLGK